MSESSRVDTIVQHLQYVLNELQMLKQEREHQDAMIDHLQGVIRWQEEEIAEHRDEKRQFQQQIRRLQEANTAYRRILIHARRFATDVRKAMAMSKVSQKKPTIEVKIKKEPE